MVLGTEVVKIGIGELRAIALVGEFPQTDDLVRLGVRKRTEQHAMDHAENGSGRANTQGESHDGNQCDAGTLSQNAQRVTRVHKEILQPSPAPCPARDFLNQRRIAQFAISGVSGVLLALALADAIVRGHPQMTLDFLFQFLFFPPSLPEWEFHGSALFPRAFRMPPTASSSCSQRE